MKILRFTAAWCAPCKILTETLKKVETNIPIDVIDIDITPCEEMDTYDIGSVLTMIAIKDGVEVARTGDLDAVALQKWFDALK